MTDPSPDSADAAPALSPEELHERIEAGERVALLDVRDRDEFEEWRISGESVEATQVPYNEFVAARVTGTVGDLAAEYDLESPVVAVCGRGEASDEVARALSAAGIEATNLEDGMEGWARVYVSREIPHPDATVLQYARPSSGCLAYLVVSDGEAAVVDPLRAFADRYVEDARDRGAELRFAVDTHVHADHVSGLRAVAAAARTSGIDPEMVTPAGAEERGLSFELRTVEDGDELAVGDATLAALHAPGHTTEMTAFRLGDLLFAGDLLFLESVARPDLESGDEGAPAAARRLHRTLRDLLSSLPGDTLVAPGHYGDAAEPAADGTYTATLDDLRDRLATLSMDETAFVEFVRSDLPPRPANDEEIVEINLGRRETDDEEAFELELGPNNCAATGG
ncbi:MBL fold metallo-hydrolase [Halegenticoccus tardaugens]|uniref:MBL fold metallo-hydrolase n=1 Tax=Halegenticoccus tardaugens TaxID=2071624 RepID=UPI00100A97A7|nr:MBL fold metallo-hydrolase [Halegenticoccus tardaugens]